MKIMLKTIAIAIAAALATAQFAHAAGLFGDTDTDPRTRAKILKEKAKQNTLRAQSFNFNDRNGQSDADCGSQNIGNVDTGGRPGTAPREIFVFAPNATNVVSDGACK